LFRGNGAPDTRLRMFTFSFQLAYGQVHADDIVSLLNPALSKAWITPSRLVTILAKSFFTLHWAAKWVISFSRDAPNRLP
jgi:hypothetical protein